MSCVQVESEVVSGQSHDDNKILDMVSDTMYFGGFPGEHEFLHTTNEDFHGCIDNVVVSSISVDLSLSKETQGTVPGCPIEVQLLKGRGAPCICCHCCLSSVILKLYRIRKTKFAYYFKLSI